MKSIRTTLHLFAGALSLIAITGCKPAVDVAATGSEPEPVPSTPAESADFKVTHLDAAAASDLVDENSELVVLDVRTPEEFAAGHIQGAINIDFKAPGFRDEVAKLDNGKTYLLHCRSGSRSTSSLPVFEELGFTGIHHLDGGFNAWKEGGNAFVTD